MTLTTLLGKNYKWWYLGIFTLKQNFIYFWNEIFTSFYRFIWLIGIITIGTHESQNKALVLYILVGSLFFAISESFMSWQVGEAIKSGKITKLLLYPTNIIGNYVVQGFFRCFYVGLSYLPWILILYLVYQPNLSENISRMWVFPLMFVASWLVRLFFDLISAFGSFWSVEFDGLAYLSYNTIAIFSGSLFPLDYFSKNIYTPINET